MKFSYGTCGFRGDPSFMGPIVQHTAFFAAVRARTLNKSVGMVISASQNSSNYNGVRLVEPTGQTLSIETEFELARIANMRPEKFEEFKGNLLRGMASTAAIQQQHQQPGQSPIWVIIGTDTRPTSPDLLKLAAKACKTVPGVGVEEFERYTMPQLHFIVKFANIHGIQSAGRLSLSHFRDAFTESFNLIPLTGCSRYTKALFVDCANGVGALWVGTYLANIELITEANKKTCIQPVELTRINIDASGTAELLNKQCGADYVKRQAKIPANFDNVPKGVRCASLDGDAGCVVYWYPDEDGGVVLLDGDHIAALFAYFIAQQFSIAKQQGNEIPLTFGVVQTAYANGNSSNYIKSLCDNVVLAKTGLKYLDKEARKFDIGIYFESSGLGTVCFSDKFRDYIKANVANAQTESKHIALLALFSRLINPVIGDGIANLLAVEYLLRHFDWSIQDWLTKTYKDIPSVQKQIKVENINKSPAVLNPICGGYATSAISDTDLIYPEGMQVSIDKIVAKFPNTRAFIRPSQTEPMIIRIYAEAETLEQANLLAKQLANLVFDHPEQIYDGNTKLEKQ